MTTTATTFLGVSAIVLLVLGVRWWIKYRREQRKLRLQQYFDAFAKRHQLSPKRQQTLHLNMIGIDRREMKLIFVDGRKMPPIPYLIDLRDIATCRIGRVRNKSTGYVQRIHLIIRYKDKDRNNLLLPVYDESVDRLYRMMRLSKKAHYWQRAIEMFRESGERLFVSGDKQISAN